MKKGVEKEQESFVHALLPTKLTCALFIVYLILVGSFLFLLDKKAHTGFGAIEIAFAFAAAFLWVAFLVWSKSLIGKNPYLGLVMGLVVVVLLAYALFVRYQGPNTLVFATVGALITVSYLLYHFFKTRSVEKQTSRYHG